MSDLVAFLRARLDDDVKLSMADGGETAMHSWTTPIYPWGNDWMTGIGIRESRLVAEVQAKRAILDRFEEERSRRDAYRSHRAREAEDDNAARDRRLQEARCRVAEDTVRLLALPYQDHPEYREEWRP